MAKRPPVTPKVRFISRVITFGFFGSIAAIAILSKALGPPEPQLTPQQIQVLEAQRQAEALAAQTRVNFERESLKEFCPYVLRCSTYADVRQQCATAGDFNNCVTVKLGSENADLAGQCTADGKADVVGPPTYFQCLKWKYLSPF